MPKGKNLELEIKLSLLVGLIGLVTSTYLVADHYSDGEHSICDISPTISCSAVLNSDYAVLFNVPIATFGVTWNLVVFGIAYKLWTNSFKENFVWATCFLVWTLLGIVFVFYLLFAEYVLGAICPFCTFIHILSFILLRLSWLIYKEHKSTPSLLTLISTTKYYVVGVGVLHLLVLLYFNIFSNALDVGYSMDVLIQFSNCLTDKGIEMYGSPKCSSCQAQKVKFKESFENIRFINCDTEPEICKLKNIEGYPTWIQFDLQVTLQDEKVELARKVGVQSLEDLSEFSMCPLTLSSPSNKDPD